VQPSTPGWTGKLCILTGIILMLSGLVAARPATQAKACAGVSGHSTSASHHRQVRRSLHAATSPKLRQVTPNTIEIGVPNPLNGKGPDYIDLVVAGSGFRRGVIVRWDDKPLATHFISSTRLKARVPFACLGVNTLHTVKPNAQGGSGPRKMGSDGATGRAWLRARNPNGRPSNRAAFTVSYVVVGG
jgi:hypothetical protein